jgi:hypothetical protein
MEELTCSSCGSGFKGKWNPDNEPGRGYCRKCRKDSYAQFCDARIPIVAKGLSEERRNKFLAKPIEEQRYFVEKCVEKGILPW